MKWPWSKNRQPRYYVELIDQFGDSLTKCKSFEGRTNMAELVFKPVKEDAIVTGYRVHTASGSEVFRETFPESFSVKRNERPRVRALRVRSR